MHARIARQIMQQRPARRRAIEARAQQSRADADQQAQRASTETRPALAAVAHVPASPPQPIAQHPQPVAQPAPPAIDLNALLAILTPQQLAALGLSAPPQVPSAPAPSSTSLGETETASTTDPPAVAHPG